MQALLTLMWTFCWYKVPYSTSCVRFCPFCAPVTMSRSPAEAKVLQVKAAGYPTAVLRKHQQPAEPLWDFEIQHLIQTRWSLKCWPLRDLIPLGICLFWLPWCLAAHPKRLVLTPRAGGRCLPQLMGTNLHCWQTNTQRTKKDHCIHMAKRSSGLLESAVSSRLIITTQTDRPSSTRGCLGPWASFGCLLHLEKHFPPEVLRQSRDWLKWQEISYLLNCFHIFSCVRELPAAATETTATDNKTLWAI